MAEVSISNTCSCDMWSVNCADCGSTESVSYEQTNYQSPRVCPACGSENIDFCDYAEICDGECFASDNEYLESEISKLNSNDQNYVFIGASNVGWQNTSGWRVESLDNIGYDTFAVNGECSQHWTFPGDGTATVVQSHHDSPTGESYQIRPATLAECVIFFSAYHTGDHEYDGDCEVVSDELVRCPVCKEEFDDLDDLNYHE